MSHPFRYQQDQEVVSIWGWTHAELQAAWDLIRPRPNWRWPVDAWIHPAKFAICNEACAYFTGCRLQRTAWRGSHAVRVQSLGYWQNLSV